MTVAPNNERFRVTMAPHISLTCGLVLLALIPAATAAPPRGDAPWCRTPTVAPPGPALGASCPPLGACDVPNNRDLFVPTPDTPWLTVRLKINVFAHTDGSSPVESPTSIAAQLATVNANYAAGRIRFEATSAVINDSTYRNFLGTGAAEVAMKTAYADAPNAQLNVYVVDTPGSYGVGTFPWQSNALAATGGIIIDLDLFGGGETVLSHEIGHCLGLWHTHHGISEVTACGACYELADGTNGDLAGDLCGDTPPTPTNFGCSAPGGGDCVGTGFGPTSPSNYMSYAPSACQTHFTPDQWGRMHCWAHNRVNGWVVDCNHNGISDGTEVADGLAPDCNANGYPDGCELDCDGSGIPDACELVVDDCDGNFNTDACDPDYDGDGLIDACDDDIDDDGVANDGDVCDFTPAGAVVKFNGTHISDTDSDCDLDATDFDRFWNCFDIGGPATPLSAACQLLHDYEPDGDVDLADFAGLQSAFTASEGDE